MPPPPSPAEQGAPIRRGAASVERSLAHLRRWERLVSHGWVLGSQHVSYVDLCLWMQLSAPLGAGWLRAHGFDSLAQHALSVAVLPSVESYSETPGSSRNASLPPSPALLASSQSTPVLPPATPSPAPRSSPLSRASQSSRPSYSASPPPDLHTALAAYRRELGAYRRELKATH